MSTTEHYKNLALLHPSSTFFFHPTSSSSNDYLWSLPSFIHHYLTRAHTIMEDLVHAQIGNPRRSGRERKPIERLAPPASGDDVARIPVQAAKSVPKGAGTGHQVKRKALIPVSQRGSKRRKTSASTAVDTSGMFSALSLYTNFIWFPVK